MTVSNPRIGWSAWGLLSAYALVVLGYSLFNADAADVVLLAFLFLPWMVGPAVVAAFLAARFSGWLAWTFLVIETAVIASTAWLWISLLMHPDAQNGIAMFLFPIVQFGGVIVAALAVLFVGWALERRRPR